MLTQRNIRTGVVMLAFAFAATSPLLFVTGNWTAMVASAQAPLEQRQLSSIPVEGKYVTRLFNLTGKQLAQFEGRVLGFSSNGQQLLTKISPTMGRYHLFDISGKELLNFEGRTAEFTPDGQHIITMLKDKDYFQLYDVSGNKLAQLPGTVLKSPIFSRNGQRLVTFTEDSAYLFDASGRQIGRMPGQFRGFGGGFDSTGQRLILYRDNPTSCTLFDSSGSKIAQLPRECAGISPNSKRFLTGVGSWDFPSTHLYDFSGKKIAELSGAIALFNPDETIILTTDFFTGNSSSYLYTSTGKRIANLKGTNGKFSSNGKRFVTIAGNTVYLYDSSGKELAQLPGDRAAFLPRSEKFVAFLFGKNRQTLDISGGQSRLFDGSGRELAVLKGDFDVTDIVMYGAGNLPPSLEDLYSKSLSFLSPDGQRLVTSDAKNSYLYNASGQQIAKLPGLSPKFSSTGQYFTVASEGKVYVFDRSGKRLIETQGEFGVFSPDGRYIAIVAKR